MIKTAHIYKISIQRFRGIHSLQWMPAAGMNVILGGGDVGKTTVLEAIALLLSPSNTAVISEADYWARDSAQEFVIEAIMSLPEATGMGSQNTFAWPWAWNGQDAVAPSADGEGDQPVPGEPVYRVRVRGTTELELAWEVMQPNDEFDHFSTAVRRRIGLVRMSADERNDRDLRLVYGSALDRLLADNALRARIGKEVAGLNLHDSLNDKGKEAIESLDARMVDAALPSDLKLGLTTSQGLSIGALIGLMATKNGVALPLSSWGAGTRRMAALEIASSTDKEASVTLIDEIERGLEPYRLRKLINILAGQHGQIFLTTHSPVAISCAEDAHLWYLDSQGSIGALPRDKIGPQQKRDPETFLARVAVIAEGPTEVGFLQYLLEKAFEGNPLDHGVRVCDGQGNGATLDLLETLASSGLLFAGLSTGHGNPEALAQSVTTFMGSVAAGFSPSSHGDRLLQEVRTGAARPTTGKPANIQEVARCLLNNPSHTGVSDALAKIAALVKDTATGFDTVKIDHSSELRDAVRIGQFAGPDEGFAEVSRMRSYSHPSLPKKVLSSIHKAKGLECDHAMLMACDKAQFTSTLYAKSKMYVALSRAKKSLTLVVPTSNPSPLFKFR